MSVPVCYELNEDGERYGGVYRFCCQECADNFDMGALPAEDQFPRYEWGKEAGPVHDEELCMECGKRIKP